MSVMPVSRSAPQTAALDEAAIGTAAWLLDAGRLLPGPAALLAALSRRLAAGGVPVWRTTLSVPTQHPEMTAMMYTWHADADAGAEAGTDGGDGVAEIRIPRMRASRLAYLHSPMALMHRTGLAVRRRLAGPDAELDFPLLEELHAQGGTDYLLSPMPLAADRFAAFGATTRDPAGFAPAHTACIEAILPALGAAAEIMTARDLTLGLLNCYVGREAAARILSGDMVVGTGRSIRAVILFGDLRDFTALSEALPRDALLALLGDYFGCLVPAVDRAGGEVLKFLGDGLLAIFRVGDGEPLDEACARGLIAALEAAAALDALNARRPGDGRPEIRSGMALHVGEVVYGNIGAGNRLDFTVIGPAVNRAARIEGMCRDLGAPILTSCAFARAAPIRLVSRGHHMLRGVDAPQELFAPAYRAFPGTSRGADPAEADPGRLG